MDLASFALALLVVAVPVLAAFSGAAWLAGRGVRRVRLASRDGRVLAEIALPAPSRPVLRYENPAREAFRP